jgi:hypothetical protein
MGPCLPRRPQAQSTRHDRLIDGGYRVTKDGRVRIAFDA